MANHKMGPEGSGATYQAVALAARTDFRRLDDGPEGGGSHADVYAAIHRPSGQAVMLKELRLGIDPAILEGEAELLAAVHHPNIVRPIYRSAPSDQDRPFLALPQLVALPKRREELLLALSGIAAGLDYAHDAGIIHCDVKPDNMMADGNCCGVLIDFSSGCRLGAENHSLGAPRYRAPELADGSPRLPASDNYSFAIGVYVLLRGTFPRLAETLPAPYQQALAPNPADRYRSAAEFMLAVATSYECR